MKIYLILVVQFFVISFCTAQNGDENETVGFKRGSKLIFTDDFSKDAVGDFPARWSSNGSGELVKKAGVDGKLFKVPAGSTVNIQLQKPLPQNFTYELDVMVPSDVPIRMMGIGFGLKPVTIHNLLVPSKALHFSIQSNNKKYSEGLKYGGKEITDGPSYKTIEYKTPLNKIIHLAFEINGRRIRLYIDDKKMVDLPTAFNAQLFKSLYLTASTHGAKESKENYFYIANATLAETVKDLRSTVIKDLFETGKASTTAIQFKTNSDAILPASNAIISELAAALKEDPTVKIKIIGHTDSDGDEVKNLTLSRKRSNAVRQKLITLGIKADRMSTDGKGETEPAADNSTEDGKAKNRRVEFLKAK